MENNRKKKKTEKWTKWSPEQVCHAMTTGKEDSDAPPAAKSATTTRVIFIALSVPARPFGIVDHLTLVDSLVVVRTRFGWRKSFELFALPLDLTNALSAFTPNVLGERHKLKNILL